MMDSCMKDCPLCSGCGFVVEDHGEDCKCAGHDMTRPDWDPRHAMIPCPNREYMVIDPDDAEQVAYAERYGFSRSVPLRRKKR